VTTVSSNDSDVYYDPFDFEIDTDPYPVWRRMRDEVPLYYNEKHEFFALSRFEDVQPALSNWDTYRSGRGTILELIKANVDIPPGNVLFEDPPLHDAHRAVMARVFTPKKMEALEPKVREFCAKALDPLIGSGRFDFIADLGAQMPMRTIGMLLGIPEDDQEAIRDRLDEGLHLAEGEMPTDFDMTGGAEIFEDYIEWRAKHPSDDLMTELLNADLEEPDGSTRKLTRSEVLTYVNMLAGAGNETTTRLIGWTGKVLGENADVRRELAEDRSLIPNAIEELLRFEAPSPVQARYVQHDVEHYGQAVPEGSIILLLNGSANRDERRFTDPDRVDIRRNIGRHLSFGYGLHFCLGASLARLEGRIALDEVLNRFPNWEIDWDNAVQARTSTVRGWESMPVITR
jgi:cytochrome P450